MLLAIAGASTNLTLIDLPGIIRSADNPEDMRYVDLTQKLTEEYMSKLLGIIVLVVSCKADIETQVGHTTA